MANKESNTKQKALVVAGENGHAVDWEGIRTALNRGISLLEYSANHNIFQQGDPADSVFYVRRGKVKLSVTSPQGKEAIVALLEDDGFFGEQCLAGQQLRIETAVTVTDCTLMRIERSAMARILHEQNDIHGLSELFVKHVLSRSLQLESDLADQLLNNSEKRLARILLQLAHFGKGTETALSGINQEDLAEMVGTTRSRVSHFMNQFRNCGCIDYKSSGELTVHDSLLRVVREGACEPLGRSNPQAVPNRLRARLAHGAGPLNRTSKGASRN